jgi:hypothetical protein
MRGRTYSYVQGEVVSWFLGRRGAATMGGAGGSEALLVRSEALGAPEGQTTEIVPCFEPSQPGKGHPPAVT